MFCVEETVFANWEAIEFTENHIKQIHRDLLKYSGKDERHRGEYKNLPNHVEAFGPNGQSLGVVFETASPFDTSRLMAELIVWKHESLDHGERLPLLVAAIFIVVFLETHPFQDGNGRLSRPAVATSWLRLCALRLTGERHRAKQGSLFFGPAPNPGHDPKGCARLATVDHLFPEGPSATEDFSREEDRARTHHPREPSGAIRANS